MNNELKKYIALLIVCLVFIIGGAVYIFSSKNEKAVLSDQEKNAALSKLLGHAPVLEEKKTTVSWISHENQYESFLYPENAKVYIIDNQTAMQEKTVLDSFYFGIEDPKVYVAIQVIQNPSVSDLSSFPSVALREQEKNIYAESMQDVSSYPATVFLKIADGVEESAFLFIRGKVYSLVVSGPGKEEVEAFFTKLTTSFQVR